MRTSDWVATKSQQTRRKQPGTKVAGQRWLGTKLMLMMLPLLMLTSCEYKELCYDHDHETDHNLSLVLNLQLDLDVDIDVSVETHTKIVAPEYMKVGFYDPNAGGLKDTEYVKGNRGDIYVTPGTYDMVAYSFGTEWTQIRGEGSVNTLEAFTSDITATKATTLSKFTRAGDPQPQGPIIYTPDHLLVAHKEVVIPPFSSERQVITITAAAATIIETYSFELVNITGAENASSVEAFVTNQARSNFFGRGELNTEPATIYFPVEVDRASGTIKTTFNTFGKLPGESHCFLHILIVNSDGREIQITQDITDQFEKDDHKIIIEDAIDIPAPEGGAGGIAPTVNPWDDVQQDVPIG